MMIEFWITPDEAEDSFKAAEDLAAGRAIMREVPPRSDYLTKDPRGSGHWWVGHKNCSDRSCMLCEGGLALCGICHLAEGELTTECLGRLLTAEELEALHATDLDYKDGKWGPRQYPKYEAEADDA